MMMIGESRRENHAPPWGDPQQQTSPPLSPSLITSAVCRYLEPDPTDVFEYNSNYFPCGDNYQDDEFFMYEFKIRKCTRIRAHDWTECPFAHPGEKARRRDPRKYNYSGTACSDFRKGGCKKGDSCEFSHGVFECWLHPTRFRTQACKDGSGCTRRVCFFAHNPDQIRVGSGLATSPRGSSHNSDDGVFSVGSGSGSGSVGELVASLRNLQLNKVKSMPSSWAGGGIGTLQIGSPVFGSPRSGCGSGSPALSNRTGFFSLPTTPTRPGIGYLDMWDNNNNNKDISEEPVMERVESGRALRARMFEKLSKENPLNGPGSDPIETSGSDFHVGWVSDLIK